MKQFLIGCGIAAGVCVLLLGACALWFANVSKPVEGLVVEVDVGDGEATVGEEFDVTITVTNEGDKAFELTSLDITEGFASTMVLTKSDPKPDGTTHVPIIDAQSYEYGDKIDGGESKTYTFTYKPSQAGVYKGELDAYVGMQSYNTTLQVLVEEPGEGGTESAPEPETEPATP